jgi:aspartate/glutamate racemase
MYMHTGDKRSRQSQLQRCEDLATASTRMHQYYPLLQIASMNLFQSDQEQVQSVHNLIFAYNSTGGFMMSQQMNICQELTKRESDNLIVPCTANKQFVEP